MAKIKLTKNELKVQKDALKMYRRYLPTLTLKKQQLQAEIRTIEAQAKAVRGEREELENAVQMAAFKVVNKILFGLKAQLDVSTWRECVEAAVRIYPEEEGRENE